MRAGKKRSPWRALRHSLFVCGLSLSIALAVSIATFVVPADETPSFLKAAASTPTQKGESTSFGVLSNIAKLAPGPDGSKRVSDTTSDGVAAATTAEESADALTEAEGAASDQPAHAVTPEARVASALTSAPPVLNQFDAETAETTVSSSRFRTSTTASVPAALTQATPGAASSSEVLQPGDRITVPLTFYYCEDTTGGSRSGDGGGFCGAMRNGDVAHPGAAACDVAYLGQRFIIEGDPTERTYVCADTGGGIKNQHRDIWFLSSSEGWAWQAVVGRSAVIQIIP